MADELVGRIAMSDRARIALLLAVVAIVLLLPPRIGVAADGAVAPAEPAAVHEGGSDAGRIAMAAADVFPIRFLSFLRLIIGGAMLVPADLFVGIGWPVHRNSELFLENYELMIAEPVEYTFKRPLGHDL